MFLKSRNIIFKIRRSKVTEYAALRQFAFLPKNTQRRGVNENPNQYLGQQGSYERTTEIIEKYLQSYIALCLVCV